MLLERPVNGSGTFGPTGLKVTNPRNCPRTTGWWFGCHQLYFPIHILFMSSSQLTNSNLFQRGGPTNHQPDHLSLWMLKLCQFPRISGFRAGTYGPHPYPPECWTSPKQRHGSSYDLMIKMDFLLETIHLSGISVMETSMNYPI